MSKDKRTIPQERGEARTGSAGEPRGRKPLPKITLEDLDQTQEISGNASKKPGERAPLPKITLEDLDETKDLPKITLEDLDESRSLPKIT